MPEDQILAVETSGYERQSRKGSGADEKRPKCERESFSQAAHLEHIVLVVLSQDHDTCTQEKESFEKSMSREMEDGSRPSANAESEEHVADLADRRIGQDALDVPLHECAATGDQERSGTDDGDSGLHDGSQGDQHMGTGYEVNTGGDHGRGMDQGADRRGASHRIRKPSLQR